MLDYLVRLSLKNTDIFLNNRKILLTVIDEPNVYLEKLSKEDNEGTLYLPYWTYLWESSIGLAKYLSEYQIKLSDKHILEIGCGYGLAGIVACQAGADVVFTDFEHDALLFARVNTEQNLKNSANFVQMNWTDPCFSFKFDVILASDVIYEEHNWQPIMCLLKTLLASSGVAIFSEPNRKNADEFFKLIRENGFTFKKSICSISLQENTAKINIYQIKHDKR